MFDKKMIGERFTVRLDDGKLISGTVVDVTETGVVVDGSIRLGPGDPVVVETANERLAGHVDSVSFKGPRAEMIRVTVLLEQGD